VFNAFITINRPPALFPRGVFASAVFHFALLGIALGSRPAHVTSAPRAMGERVQQIDIAFASPVIAATRGPVPMAKRKAPPRPREALVTVPELPELPSQVDLPLIDTESMIDTPLQLSAGTAVQDVQESVGTPRLGSSDGSAVASTVDGSADSSAVQFPENPKPTYPADMLRQTIEAQFVVYFMIDSTGRVDASSIEVPPSVRPSFAVAVREALCQWHFYPAHKQGRPVRQFVGQEFMFRIVRPRQWDGTSAA
jgi:TonB family protein